MVNVFLHNVQLAMFSAWGNGRTGQLDRSGINRGGVEVLGGQYRHRHKAGASKIDRIYIAARPDVYINFDRSRDKLHCIHTPVP